MLGAITASLTPKGAFIIYVACKGFRTLNLKKEIKIKKKIINTIVKFCSCSDSLAVSRGSSLKFQAFNHKLS